MTQPFDIAQLDTRTRAISGVDMPIVHPRSGAPILRSDGSPVTIRFLGPASDARKAISKEVTKRRLDMEARGIQYSDDDWTRDSQEILSNVTIGWTIEMFDGQAFPYSPDNARRLWADQRWLWLRQTAMTFINQEANFLAS